MSKNRKSIVLSNTFYELEELKKDIPNAKLKRKIDKHLIEFKRLIDKCYYNAYYDYRFNCSNYNKLLEDVSQLESKQGFKLLFIRVDGLTRSYYMQNSIYNKAMTMLDDLKKYQFKNKDCFKTNSIYVVDNFIVLVVRNKYIGNIYQDLKVIKNKYSQNFGIVYTSYNKISSKVSKCLNYAICEAIRITQDNINFEEEKVSFVKKED